MRSLDTVIAWVDGSDDEYKRTKGYNFEITETALSISSLALSLKVLWFSKPVRPSLIAVSYTHLTLPTT